MDYRTNSGCERKRKTKKKLRGFYSTFNHVVTNYPITVSGRKRLLRKESQIPGLSTWGQNKKPGSYQPYEPGLVKWTSAAVCCPTALQVKTQTYSRSPPA